jgi:hypothetical protein
MEILEHFRVSMITGFGGEENLDEPMEAWLSISSYQNRVNLLIIFFFCVNSGHEPKNINNLIVASVL